MVRSLLPEGQALRSCGVFGDSLLDHDTHDMAGDTEASLVTCPRSYGK